MRAYRVEATVDPDRSVTLTALPFHPGERVEIIVLSAPKNGIADDSHPLRGSILRYDDPTDPVAEDDWEAIR